MRAGQQKKKESGDPYVSFYPDLILIMFPSILVRAGRHLISCRILSLLSPPPFPDDTLMSIFPAMMCFVARLPLAGNWNQYKFYCSRRDRLLLDDRFSYTTCPPFAPRDV